MSCNIIMDSCLRVEFPVVEFRNDILVPTPQLVGPVDGDTYCVGLGPNGETGICLQWQAAGTIPGNTRYLVQWSQNPQFEGPTVREAIVADSGITLQEYCLIYPDDIRYGETVYWRIIAADIVNGGVSNKSETRQVTLNCNDSQYDNQTFSNRCAQYNVDMNIRGCDCMSCCGSSTVWLEMTYGGFDVFDNALIEVADVVWSVKVQDQTVSSDDYQNIDCDTTEDTTTTKIIRDPSNMFKAVIDACESETQVAQITAEVTFDDLTLLDQFTCNASSKIILDCDFEVTDVEPIALNTDYIKDEACGVMKPLGKSAIVTDPCCVNVATVAGPVYSVPNVCPSGYTPVADFTDQDCMCDCIPKKPEIVFHL